MYSPTKPGSEEYKDLALLRKKQGYGMIRIVNQEYEDEKR